MPIRRSAQFTPFLTKLRSSVGGLFDERQPFEKRRVAARLVVTGQAREQRERGALAELVALASPGRDAPPRMRRLVEQLEADGVDDAPVVEVAAPAIHLRRRDAQPGRRRRPRASAPRTSPCPTTPAPARGCVRSASRLLDVRHRDAEGLRRIDAESHEVVDVLLRAEFLERRERVLDLLAQGRAVAIALVTDLVRVSASGAAACAAV